jgi:hypothetical protein
MLLTPSPLPPSLCLTHLCCVMWRCKQPDIFELTGTPNPTPAAPAKPALELQPGAVIDANAFQAQWQALTASYDRLSLPPSTPLFFPSSPLQSANSASVASVA